MSLDLSTQTVDDTGPSRAPAAARRRRRADRRHGRRSTRPAASPSRSSSATARPGLGAAGGPRGRAAERPRVATRRRAAPAELGIHIVVAGRHRQARRLRRHPGRARLRRRRGGLHGRRPAGPAGARRVGLSAAPADAVDDVRSRVHWVSQHPAAAAPSANSSNWCSRRSGRWDSHRARLSGVTCMQGYGIVFGVLAGAAGRPGRRQGLGALQARRRPLDRSAARPAVAALHPRPQLPRRRAGRPGDRGARERARRLDPGALELHLVLGNLYREKGQVGRAIQEHQALLQRPRLNAIEHANVLLCLGLDYRRGGFVDRAVRRVLRCPEARPEQRAGAGQPREAAGRPAPVAGGLRHAAAPGADRRAARPAEVAADPRVSRKRTRAAGAKEGRLDDAIRRFEAAIDLDRGVMPAYLHLGDAQAQQGDLARPRSRPGNAPSTVAPDRAYLALDRLEQAYATTRRRPSASPSSAGG